MAVIGPFKKLFEYQNAKYKAEQAAKAKAAPNSPTKAGPGRLFTVDECRARAQQVSDAYKPGSIARPKYYSGGQVVAK